MSSLLLPLGVCPSFQPSSLSTSRSRSQLLSVSVENSGDQTRGPHGAPPVRGPECRKRDHLWPQPPTASSNRVYLGDHPPHPRTQKCLLSLWALQPILHSGSLSKSPLETHYPLGVVPPSFGCLLAGLLWLNPPPLVLCFPGFFFLSFFFLKMKGEGSKRIRKAGMKEGEREET